MKLVEAAPAIEEEVVTGSLSVLALFDASVRKEVNKSGKMPVAGCKVRSASCCLHWVAWVPCWNPPLACCRGAASSSSVLREPRACCCYCCRRGAIISLCFSPIHALRQFL